jgi:hypothetical protein
MCARARRALAVVQRRIVALTYADRYGFAEKGEGAFTMSESVADADQAQTRVIEQIVELQREFYFENKGKESERRRRLRDIIERATGAQGDE